MLIVPVMQIAFIEPHINVCGGIRRVIEFSNRLSDLGHAVTWFIPDWVYDSKQLGGWMPQKFNVYPLRYTDMLRGSITDKEKKPPRYDVVVFNEETQWQIARKFPADVRVYYALHWAVLHKDYNMLRNCYNGGFRIMANSTWTAESMLLETGSLPEVVYGGITEALFHPVSVPKQYDILAYGATRAWKGTDLVKAVFEKLVAQDKDLTMMTFGDNSGIKQEDMADAYGVCRVYLSASWYEGWGWPALEAMACGTPVVMSDDGGCRDYAVNNENCLMFKPRDVEHAASLVRRVLEDPRLAQRLSHSGLETAKRFRWDPEVKKMEALFKKWLYERTTKRTGTSQ